MKRVLAIALLTLRESVRSGAAVALFCLVVILVGWFALTLQGDGTLAGQVRVFLRYATGTVAAVLGLATLWLAAARIASEVDDRTIQTLAVKPVRAAEIWAGKWLGLVLLNAALLAACGAVVATGAFCIMNLSGERTAAEKEDARRHSLVCRFPVAPVPDRAGAVETECDGDEDETVRAAHPHEQMASRTVPPGGSRTWTFDIGRAPAESLWMQFNFDFGSSDRLPMAGTWSVSRPGDSNALWSAAVSNLPAGRHRMPVSLSAAPGNALALTYSSAATPDSGVVVFRSSSGVVLLAGESSMVIHLFRALLIVLLKLSVLAAAGLACSALFHTPVAIFAATALALMTICVQYFLALSEPGQPAHACGHNHGPPPPTAWYERTAESVSRAAAVIVRPVDSLDGIEPVSDGLAVPWTLVGRSALVLIGCYSLVLAALGVIALRRRELADT